MPELPKTTWSIIIREPFERKCAYEFDTRAEALDFVKSLSVILGFDVTADIYLNSVQTIGNC